MARWLVVVLVVLGGAFLLSQWFGGEAAANAADVPTLKLSEGAARPDGAQAPVPRGDEPAKLAAERAQRPGAAEPRSDSAAGEAAGPSVAMVLDRAEALQMEGKRADALALLRDERSQARTPRERARLGLKLALLGGGPRERRMLLGEALVAGQVFGGEYEAVGAVLEELNADPGVSLIPLVKTASYRVRPNDSLWKLCHRTLPELHQVEPEVGMLRLLNGMRSDGLHVDQELAVPLEEVRLVVDREQRGITVWLGAVPVAAYRVGLGKDGSTPSGQFVVQVKQENPAWTYRNETIPFGDERNILGTRWLGFENHPGVTGYGIHGTARPETIGRDESMGCVRMRNAEVEQLFDLVPRGTTVVIP